ncbi:MAG: PGF-pre-PGF domain-containing protein [Candidatus Hadarchaeota archaeon]
MKKSNLAVALCLGLLVSAFQVGIVAAQNDMGSGGDAGSSLDTAATIALLSGTGYMGYLEGVLDDSSDYYKVYVSSGQTISVSMTPWSGADAGVDVWTSENELEYASPLFGDSTKTYQKTAAQSGYFYIIAINRGGGQVNAGYYSLTISVSDATPSATPTTQTETTPTPSTQPTTSTPTTTTTTAAISTATASASIAVSTNVGQVLSATENGITSIIVSSSNAVVVDFSENKLVKSMVITTSAAMQSVSVQVQQTVQKPASVSEPTAAVQGTVLSHYLEINVTPTAATSVAVDNAVIDFKVLKSWVAANNIDSSTVRLLRNVNSQWTELTTQSTGADDATYLYYRASSPGLSTFAVVGRQASAGSNLMLIMVIVVVAVVAAVAIAAAKLRK